ncbi:hypothetical protein [Nesterenkonia sp. NBAIMH1]|uniref:hypothetical protein n=1 Tax=Nesterenkonia sp. NBAIMH1 TaxID=2600320 RepID=UPI0011B462F9|nr:hypothetical protein [Nesterenkonia sp. NBAIMH1]
MVKSVDIEEFRERLEIYLAGTDPIVIHRGGQTLGHCIPLTQRQAAPQPERNTEDTRRRIRERRERAEMGLSL